MPLLSQSLVTCLLNFLILFYPSVWVVNAEAIRDQLVLRVVIGLLDIQVILVIFACLEALASLFALFLASWGAEQSFLARCLLFLLNILSLISRLTFTLRCGGGTISISSGLCFLIGAQFFDLFDPDFLPLDPRHSLLFPRLEHHSHIEWDVSFGVKLWYLLVQCHLSFLLLLHLFVKDLWVQIAFFPFVFAFGHNSGKCRDLAIHVVLI